MTLYIAKPASRKKIREATNTIREMFDLKDELYFPVVKFLEWGMPEFDKKINFEILPFNKLPNRYAVTFPKKNLIYIREDVYDAAAEGIGRDRFTIAHEIGHYVMHRPGNIELARSENVDSIPAYKDPEWQVNVFAAELLAPPSIISGLTVAEIAECCGVSHTVGRIQTGKLRQSKMKLIKDKSEETFTTYTFIYQGYEDQRRYLNARLKNRTAELMELYLLY
ncbi:ImmA/IrrE family metallo-endopeptidase [Sporosarcina sp. ITBMC105]